MAYCENGQEPLKSDKEESLNTKKSAIVCLTKKTTDKNVLNPFARWIYLP